MNETRNPGHRQRLKERFIAGEDASRSEEGLLELLLTYAIPQQDVQPIARALIARFGGLSALLSAAPEALCQLEGVKLSTATLLKLTDWIRTHYATNRDEEQAIRSASLSAQPPLFDLTEGEAEANTGHAEPDAERNEPGPGQAQPDAVRAQAKPPRQARPRPRTPVFSKAVLAETIDLLPRLPDTESVDVIREFLRENLHYSGAETRHRYASYITQRMFPAGRADHALLSFARKYEARQELRDVCFYRFCVAEPLMFEVIEEVLLPAIGSGRAQRGRLRDYLAGRFPDSGAIRDCGWAIVEAMTAARVVRADRDLIYPSYRDVPDASFAFVLHSEFPEPGMYDIARAESNRALRALLWKPDKIIEMLYELRNRGILSKVSQIDNFRQFTTKWSLGQVVDALVGQGGGA